MPEFLSRPLEWFRARPRTQQALIGAGVLIVLVAASQVVSALAGLFFIAAVAAFLVQLVRRRSARPWAIAAGGALVAAIVFGGLASAIYGPVEDQAEVDRAEEQVVEEEPEQPRDQDRKKHNRKKLNEKSNGKPHAKQSWKRSGKPNERPNGKRNQSRSLSPVLVRKLRISSILRRD